MESYWIPGVNNLGSYGRWAFAELTDAFAMEETFGAMIDAAVGSTGESATIPPSGNAKERASNDA